MRVGEVLATDAAEAIKPLTGFGWEWRADGAILTLLIDGAPIRVFASLPMIWQHISREMSAAGCPLAGGVGEPMSVGGLFDSIERSVGGSLESAKTMVDVINHQYSLAPSSMPRATLVAHINNLNNAYGKAHSNQEKNQLEQDIGRVLDLVLQSQGLDNYAGRAYMRYVWPTIHGNIQQLSSGGGGGLIGAIASAAASVVHAAATAGKSIVNSKIVRYGLDAAALAVPALAPVAAGLEAAHQAIKYVDDGVAAAKQIKNGVTTAQNVAKVALGLSTQRAVSDIVQQAHAGSQAAQRTVGAFQQLALARAAAAAPNPHAFLATVLQRSPQMAVHQQGLLQIANAAREAKQSGGLKPYRVRPRAA
jgi:hypothetical protein